MSFRKYINFLVDVPLGNGGLMWCHEGDHHLGNISARTPHSFVQGLSTFCPFFYKITIFPRLRCHVSNCYICHPKYFVGQICKQWQEMLTLSCAKLTNRVKKCAKYSPVDSRSHFEPIVSLISYFCRLNGYGTGMWKEVILDGGEKWQQNRQIFQNW